jgi:hypothetical protein
MRTILIILILHFATAVKSQTTLPVSNMYHLQQRSFAGNILLKDSIPAKKWFVSKYFGISTSFGVFNGSTATVLSVPVGLQLNYRLSNNWYAFAGVAMAPAYINFNQSFLNTNSTKSFQQHNYIQSNRFDMYSKAELGLMYINDQKTFSVSASIGIEKSSYPIVPFNQISAARPNTLWR